jgi:DedD protein
MGAVVLVLGAVLGFPLLFDSQPRPVAIDTPIVIPDRNQVSALSSTVTNAKTAASKEGLVLDPALAGQSGAAKSALTNSAGLDPHEEVVTKDGKTEVKSDPKVETKPELKAEAKPEIKAETKPEPKAEPKPETKPETKPEPKTEAKKDVKAEAKTDAKDGAKAKALLDGKETPKAGEAVRSVVQVGAYADLAKAKEARAKLESAGFKTYTQEVDTKDGKRIRVRVGPFASKEEADKTAEKIRKLNLQTSVLKL